MHWQSVSSTVYVVYLQSVTRWSMMQYLYVLRLMLCVVMRFSFDWLRWNVFLNEILSFKVVLVWLAGLVSGASLNTFKPNMSRLCAVLMVFEDLGWSDSLFPSSPFVFVLVFFFWLCLLSSTQSRHISAVTLCASLKTDSDTSEILLEPPRLNAAKIDSWVNGRRMEWRKPPLVRIAVFSVQSQVFDVSIGGYFANICKYWAVGS